MDKNKALRKRLCDANLFAILFERCYENSFVKIVAVSKYC